MRYFVAAFPSEDVRQALVRQIEMLRALAPRARPTQPRNLHLTVAFIGSMGDELARTVALACESFVVNAFDWEIDCIGHFPRVGVVWAGGKEYPPLIELMQHLSSLLDDMAVAHDRRAAIPHVTLLRNVRDFKGSRSIEPAIRWPISAIGLYGSTRDKVGSVYRRIEAAQPVSA
jgi:2'-5' RNA ligase